VRLSVVIPVLDGGDNFGRCLAALEASTRSPDEVIVVDDGSTDGSGDLARRHGARVVRLDGPPRGPAFARNRGAEAAVGDVLVFLDADVAVHPDTLARVERHLAEQPQLAALFGSYDADPPARGLVTRYKNLLHHYVHQHARREAFTFWAGCGAIRRDVLAALGGFDEGYARPAIEDIELGARLHRAGHRVWLCADVQVTHLKRWTLGSLLRSDVVDRAIPWTRLIVREGRLPADLNLDARGRLGALAAWLIVLFLGLGFWYPWAWAGSLLAAAALGALNARLYRFMARHGGTGFAVGAAGLHTLYLLYSSLVFASIAGPAWLARHGLALVLLVTLFKGLVWSVVVPPWHAPDENGHFLHAQLIERFHLLRAEPGAWRPQEVGRLWLLAQLPEVRYSPAPLDLSDRAGIAEQVAALDDPAVKTTYLYDDGPGFHRFARFVSFHPPLYYVLLALVQWPLEGASILVRVLACRWVSTVLGVVTVAVAYAAGRELWPQRAGWALVLATLVSFQPMATFSTAVIGNQALEIALFSACLLVSLRIVRHGLTWQRSLALGTLAGLGLLSKLSFLSVLPFAALLPLWQAGQLRSRGRGGWRTLWPWVLSALPPLLIAGWWYRGALLGGGESLLRSFEPAAGTADVSLLTYLLRYGWYTVYQPLLHMYWGDFGWLDTPLPDRLYLLLTWVTVVAAWTAGWTLVRRLTAGERGSRGRETFSLLLLGWATLCFVAFYTYLDFRWARDLGGRFNLQGRYYLPPIVGQMAWLALGLVEPAPGRLRRAWTWLVGGGMVTLNLVALVGVVAPRYYGAGALPVLLERATAIQPVGPPVLAALCVVFLALTAALLVALWAALAPRAAATP
jgi:glycosyltransferase involved in cell wall biosynthesis